MSAALSRFPRYALMLTIGPWAALQESFLQCHPTRHRHISLRAKRRGSRFRGWGAIVRVELAVTSRW